MIPFTSGLINGAGFSKIEYLFLFFEIRSKRQFCQDVIGVKGMNSLFLQLMIKPEMLPEELIYFSRMGMETTGSGKLTGRSSAYRVTRVPVKPDLIPLLYRCAAMCWGSSAILNSGADNESPDRHVAA